MYQSSDILLYGPNSKPLAVYDYDNSVAGAHAQESIYFSPMQWEHLGQFSPTLLYQPLGDATQDVGQYDRQMLLRISRKLYATMPEVQAASAQLANLTVGLGFAPLFNGDDGSQQWGENAEINLETNFFNSCSPYGMAYDWRAIWKLVSYLVDRDGDVLLIPYTDRFGALKLTFVEAHRVTNRPGQVEVNGGRFDGYAIDDGIILNQSGYPIGYQVIGNDETQDRQLSVNQAQLIYNPFSFSKFRGLPSITYAMRSAASLQEIERSLEMVIKLESMIYLQVKNEMGQAPRRQVKFITGNEPTQPNKNAVGFTPPIYQDVFAGIKYIRHKDELKSFDSKRPGEQTMQFIEHLQKGILLGTGIPYQWILNPESVSGASSRGIKEQITKAVQARGQLLNKYAVQMIVKAVANGMANGTIPENYAIDPRTNQPVFANWQLSQAAELMLDIGYEKQADVTAYLTGLMSADEILQKYGKRYKTTLKSREKNVRLLLDTVIKMRSDYAKYPDLQASILNLMQKEDFVPPQLPNAQPEQVNP